MGLGKDDACIREAIRLAVLDEDMEGLVEGLGTMVGPKGVKLSGGQLQRAAASVTVVPDSV
jgi:ATP-binding cassette subfamily B protein